MPPSSDYFWHNVLVVQKGLQITLVRVTLSHCGIIMAILMVIVKTAKIMIMMINDHDCDDDMMTGL